MRRVNMMLYASVVHSHSGSFDSMTIPGELVHVVWLLDHQQYMCVCRMLDMVELHPISTIPLRAVAAVSSVCCTGICRYVAISSIFV